MSTYVILLRVFVIQLASKKSWVCFILNETIQILRHYFSQDREKARSSVVQARFKYELYYCSLEFRGA